LTTVDWRNLRRETDRQLAAGIRGAADEVTFGLADRGSAAVRAVVPTLEGADWREEYAANMAEERAQDRYDAENYGAARAIGRVGGVAGSLFIPAGPIVRGGKMLAGAARVAMRTPAAKLALEARPVARAMEVSGRALDRAERVAQRLLPRRKPGAAATNAVERAGWLLVPGAVNVGVQAGVDLASGRTPTWEDLGGAFAGGVVAGRTRGLGGARSAAIGAATTSAYQDRLNGREFSPARAATSAVTGAIAAHLGGTAALRYAQHPTTGKGILGEVMGVGRMLVNGRMPRLRLNRLPWSRPYDRIGDTRRGWFPDAQSGKMFYEFKIGGPRPLSGSQRLAQDYYGDNFTLYHFVPVDAGQVAAMASGIAGRPAADLFYD
jgi:hypothetical protein